MFVEAVDEKACDGKCPELQNHLNWPKIKSGMRYYAEKRTGVGVTKHT